MAIDRTEIREGMDVVAADGQPMGKVDRLDGERIKLSKSGSADGQHHFVKLIDAEAVRDGKVWLNGQAVVH